MLPAVGQGVVAVECLESDFQTRSMLASIDHHATRCYAEAEREVLWLLNGHCNAPLAALAERQSGGGILLKACVMSLDGKKMLQSQAAGAADRPRELGRKVGLHLLDQGAAKLIDASRPVGN